MEDSDLPGRSQFRRLVETHCDQQGPGFPPVEKGSAVTFRLGEEQLDYLGGEPDTGDAVDVDRKAEEIRNAIFALPEPHRIILSLLLLEGYDHDEVSGILQISNAASRTQFHRAKKKLLELLGDENEEKR
ncbi:MAG: sigma factor-like helix-turn-helix DNA-binding protein [Bacteroidales bacterium]